ncbi:TfoX/Sxy family protein [Mucilaginibacter segetis]|uniref:TfoX/Sxy family protein n=1 Tax=Mucilaginibacter segetis TaxID=2793071 RepID=A0A934UMB1_9SPHI|nr:TfoX/Sxy family protein [Mucilaginibacter segetis]MBK0378850.1 TfoX/Sxy family protein [Mucilaginibacter segetis]
MPVNEELLNRVREALMDIAEVTEKRMFGGICFMVNNKLCVCVNQHEILCRIGPDEFDNAIEQNGTRPMQQGDRTAKGYVFVDELAIQNKVDFDYWIGLALTYNKVAKSSKKRR